MVSKLAQCTIRFTAIGCFWENEKGEQNKINPGNFYKILFQKFYLFLANFFCSFKVSTSAI
jgi:hypothetical protein